MNKNKIVGLVSIIVVSLLGLFGYMITHTNIKAGFVGYVYDRTLKPDDSRVIQGTSVIDKAVTGRIGINPLTQEVYTYPTTVVSRSWTKDGELKDQDQAFIVGTKEGQNVVVDIYMSVQPQDVGKIIKIWGGQDFETIVDRELYGLAKGKASIITQNYSVYNFQASKSTMQKEIFDSLSTDLKEKYGILLVRLEMGNTVLPADIQTKINEKASAINAVELTKLEKERQDVENEKIVALQKAESQKELIQKQMSADANSYEITKKAEANESAAKMELETAKLKKQAELELQQTYTDSYLKNREISLKYEAIKALNERLTVVIDNGDGTGLSSIPVINEIIKATTK